MTDQKGQSQKPLLSQEHAEALEEEVLENVTGGGICCSKPQTIGSPPPSPQLGPSPQPGDLYHPGKPGESGLPPTPPTHSANSSPEGYRNFAVGRGGSLHSVAGSELSGPR